MKEKEKEKERARKEKAEESSKKPQLTKQRGRTWIRGSDRVASPSRAAQIKKSTMTTRSMTAITEEEKIERTASKNRAIQSMNRERATSRSSLELATPGPSNTNTSNIPQSLATTVFKSSSSSSTSTSSPEEDAAAEVIGNILSHVTERFTSEVTSPTKLKLKRADVKDTHHDSMGAAKTQDADQNTSLASTLVADNSGNAILTSPTDGQTLPGLTWPEDEPGATDNASTEVNPDGSPLFRDLMEHGHLLDLNLTGNIPGMSPTIILSPSDINFDANFGSSAGSSPNTQSQDTASGSISGPTSPTKRKRVNIKTSNSPKASIMAKVVLKQISNIEEKFEASKQDNSSNNSADNSKEEAKKSDDSASTESPNESLSKVPKRD